MKMLSIILLCFLFSCKSSVNFEDLINIIKDGDIIFQVSKSSQSKAIQSATNSKYSHMGIIYIKDSNAFVYEAHSKVKLTPLKDWIERGKDNHFVIKRVNKNLSSTELETMKKFGEKFKNLKYDIYFEWSDKAMYCSELVWKIYK